MVQLFKVKEADRDKLPQGVTELKLIVKDDDDGGKTAYILIGVADVALQPKASKDIIVEMESDQEESIELKLGTNTVKVKLTAPGNPKVDRV